MKNDFERTINRICDYSGIDLTEDLVKEIKAQALKQPSFKAKHKYSLEEYGFTEEEVNKDFDFIYSKYNI